MIASGQIDLRNRPSDEKLPFMIGELALDGRLNGVLPLTLFARAQGFDAIILPEANAEEAAVVDGINVLPAKSLLAVARHLADRDSLSRYESNSDTVQSSADIPDMSDIRGQQQALP